ncbi:MAG: 2-C-methyl-D-erythritol 2,4-cyclodiphosphate synthase [Candidatus Sumerlaeia bacterium]|nr:2-C-methyl-D-erythritol 2,4-cyclodiphosphate synthase [Candidatus Sumerlaeia bacterium]
MADATAPPPFAVGFGYDVHQLARHRRLVLGGVELPHDLGLLGHSDADVLIHAIADAVLGAAGLGDIGRHFPNTEQRWKDADSRVLLRIVVGDVQKLGWRVGNVDATVIAEAPRISPHVALMCERLSADLAVAPAQVNIKATTNERMGFLGRGEGIAAMATALLFRAG